MARQETSRSDQIFDGGDRQINCDRIRFALQQSGLKVLGTMLDADDSLLGRWESIRNICTPLMLDFPEELPETGLIHASPNGVKFGVWIMPDKQNRGILETFLAYLILDRSEPIITIW